MTKIFTYSFFCFTSLFAAIYTVPDDFQTIQSAIDNISQGDTVIIEPGTYYENINFKGKNVVVASRFLLTGDTTHIGSTIIDGNAAGTVVTFENYETRSCILTGLTITNGFLENNTAFGAGILCNSASPTLDQLIITENNASWDFIGGSIINFGGGIACISNKNPGIKSSPLISNIQIFNNRCSGGAGLYCDNANPEIAFTNILSNTATAGGGVFLVDANPVITNSNIKSNIAVIGSGIYCESSSPTLNNIYIGSNQNKDANIGLIGGGGIYMSSNSRPIMRYVIIANNKSGVCGSLCSGRNGGGIFCHSSFPILINCIIFNNLGREGNCIYSMGTSEILLINTIIWNSRVQVDIYLKDETKFIISCCDVIRGEENINKDANVKISWLAGNINQDPKFLDDSFALTTNSPCIDAGLAYFEYGGEIILDLQPNDYEGFAPDIGAFEKMDVTQFIYPGDTDNNGIVNALDILPIGIYFLKEGSERPGLSLNWKPQMVRKWTLEAVAYVDVNGDGIIDEKDIVGIGLNWNKQHEMGNEDYQISMDNILQLRAYRENFIKIYNALKGESDAVTAMKQLLKSILSTEIPDEFALTQNYPNPFNSGTAIRFSLPQDQKVSLIIYNLLGQKILCDLDKVPYKAGNHTYILKSNGMASGVYFYTLITEKWHCSRKMLLIK